MINEFKYSLIISYFSFSRISSICSLEHSFFIRNASDHLDKFSSYLANINNTRARKKIKNWSAYWKYLSQRWSMTSNEHDPAYKLRIFITKRINWLLKNRKSIIPKCVRINQVWFFSYQEKYIILDHDKAITIGINDNAFHQIPSNLMKKLISESKTN